ncbi:MAG: phage tail protein [Alphaproteobacteria bacterium]|nr:phage tail protein [Alphaproteobacteria bacterium]
MSTPFIAQIVMFAGTFAPRGWAFCDGQLLPISTYTALFSLVGTTYGGDGRTTFALPDLRGRVPMHPGTGPGLSSRRQGDRGGRETITLSSAQLPAHSHGLLASGSAGVAKAPTGNALASFGTTHPPLGIYASDAPNLALHAGSVGNTGGGEPVNILPPYATVQFIIALEGVFPSRG